MSTVKEKQSQKESPPIDEAILTSIVINGDVGKLTQEQKVDYYRMMCERVGLNPISQPFKYLRLSGRDVLYCDRVGAQQLNKMHNVSHEIVSREIINGCYVVTARASLTNDRHTESIGAVPIENLKGDAYCNAIMKSETKAKRRATLDLLGLGMLDETEIDTVPNAQIVEPPSYDNFLQGSPFKKNYEKCYEISNVLKTATDIKEVAALYYQNAELIESDVVTKQEFSLKKNYLYNKQLPPSVQAEPPVNEQDEFGRILNGCIKDLLLQKSLNTLNFCYNNSIPTSLRRNPELIKVYQEQKQKFEEGKAEYPKSVTDV